MRPVAAAIVFLLLPPAAHAACFENLGQTGCTDKETFSRATLSFLSFLSCQSLWTVRNSIYDDHGYCFKTKAAREVFDNSDCYENDASQLRFNRHEQANIDRIVRMEKEKGCRAR